MYSCSNYTCECTFKLAALKIEHDQLSGRLASTQTEQLSNMQQVNTEHERVIEQLNNQLKTAQQEVLIKCLLLLLPTLHF